MAELLILLIIVSLSLVIVRAGAIALEKTGLSRQSAMFQSPSAFMLVGFTTDESEHVVNHPVRRRIIRTLMLVGFGAATGTLGTFVVALAGPDEGDISRPLKLSMLAGGLVVIWIVYKLEPFERLLEAVLRKALESGTELHIVDFEEMLRVHKGYTIANLPIDDDGWMVARTLRELELAGEGVLVLSITRENGVVLGTPASSTRLQIGDRILCYGLEEDLARLGIRSAGAAGDPAHELAKKRQRLRLVEERVEDQIAEAEPPPLAHEERADSGLGQG